MGAVPVSHLEAMADQINSIAFIRLPYQPRPLVVTSEEVALTSADDFHTAGYYGQGTKVAIIVERFKDLLKQRALKKGNTNSPKGYMQGNDADLP